MAVSQWLRPPGQQPIGPSAQRVICSSCMTACTTPSPDTQTYGSSAPACAMKAKFVSMCLRPQGAR